MAMNPVTSAGQVFEAMQRVKSDSPAFCTNFFPVQPKLDQWIARGDLAIEARDRAAFFLRKDRDFWRLYFCASSEQVLDSELAHLDLIWNEPIILDVIGNRAALEGWTDRLKPVGLHQYRWLQRMARIAHGPALPLAGDLPAVAIAAPEDAPRVLELLEDLFDHYGDQLPSLFEIEAAIAAHQLLLIRSEDSPAAVLFFETHGLTSTVRFWAVARAHQSRRFGAALMCHYFALHQSVKRFNLWVAVDNQNAIEKYQHYGYLPDGLFDLILANAKIPR